MAACEHGGRLRQGADIGNRFAIDDEQVGVIADPQSALLVSQAAGRRGERGCRGQGGDRAHAAFNQETAVPASASRARSSADCATPSSGCLR